MNSSFSELDMLAFDYVSGVMRGEERKAFVIKLGAEPELQQLVSFWEGEFMNMNDPEQERTPDKAIWTAIEKRINQDKSTSATNTKWSWQKWFGISATGLSLASVVLCAILFLPLKNPSDAHPDYVAVLTTSQGNPLLTALTTAKAKTLFLKWEALKVSSDKNLQLWAISRRDGQTRSLAVFTNIDSRPLALTDTHMHLIRDAAFLLLTEEEIGGSALDEPSAIVIAKGACVFLNTTNKTL